MQWPFCLTDCISSKWCATDACAQFWHTKNGSIEHVETLNYTDFIAFTTSIAHVLKEHVRGIDISRQSDLLVGIIWRSHILTSVALHAVVCADLAFYPVNCVNPDQLWLLANNLIAVISLVPAENTPLLPTDYLKFTNDDSYEHYGVFKRKDWSLWLRKVESHYSMPAIPRSEDPQAPNSRLAYIITTSGSCGGPTKLVFVADSCLTANIFDLITRFPSEHKIPSDRCVLLTAPLTFDPSLVQIYFSLANHQCLLIPSDDLLLRPSSLHQLVTKAGVTWVQCTPGLWLQQSVSCQAALISRSQLTVVFGGESLPAQNILDHFNKGIRSMASLYNIYGVTEVSSWATMCQLQSYRGNLCAAYCECLAPVSGASPIGSPMFATHVDLTATTYSAPELTIMRHQGGHTVVKLDNTDPVTPLSEQGYRTAVDRLHVPSSWSTGDLVCRGACGQCLWYVGRSDRMVKRFGHQICLDRLEQVIGQHRPAAAKLHGCKCEIVSGSSGRSQKMIAFIAFTSRRKMKLSEVKPQKQRLKQSVLGYLKKQFGSNVQSWLPTDVIFYRRRCLPLSTHGKIQGVLRRPSYFCKTSRFEEILKSILTFAIGLATPAALSSGLTFYELGGTSLSLLVFLDNFLHEFPQFTAMRDHLVTLLLDNSLSTFSQFVTTMHKQPVSLPSINRDPDNANNSRVLITSTQTDPTDSLPHLISLWQCPLGKCVDAAALVITPDMTASIRSPSAVIGSHSGKLAAIDLATGIPHNVVDLNARIEASACHLFPHGNGAAVAVGTLDGLLHVVDMEVAQTMWSFDTGGAVKSAPTYLPDSGILLCGSHGRLIHALDPRNNNHLLWSADLDQSPIVGTIASTDGNTVVAASLGGCFGLLDLRMSGRLLWHQKASSPVFAGPVVCQSEETQLLVIIAGVKGDLTACRLMDGLPVWNHHLNNTTIFNDPLLVSNGKSLLIPSGNGHLTSIDAQTDGHTQWLLDCRPNTPTTVSARYALSRPAFHSIGDGYSVIITRSDGTVLLFACPTVDDGRNINIANIPRSTYSLPAESFSTPVVGTTSTGDCDKHTLLVGCRDDRLHCITIQ